MDVSFIIFSGFYSIYDYVVSHTLFCLVPAFFIAGAMSSLIPKEKLLQYLGKDSPKIIAYPLAVVSGLLLAVCSCTVLPLFAGIRKGGAGLGPAIAFLYTAPATNIVAVLYTASLIGWDIAIARIVFSILFAVIVGIAVSSIFKEESEKISVKFFKKSRKSKKVSHVRLFYLFAALLAILLVGTRISEDALKYGLTIFFVGLTYFVAKKYFSKEEIRGWLSESIDFAKKIFPLLLLGVFASGIVKAVVPGDLIASYVGGSDFFSLALPVLFGIFVYFPSLVEVPMAKAFLELGMSKAALMAYVLADPVVSLPSLLVVKNIMGSKRTLVYAILIFFLSIIGGYVFGLFA